jgi:hypothetical protein
MRDAEIVNLKYQLDRRLRELDEQRTVRVTYELFDGSILELVPRSQSAGGATRPTRP